MRRSPPSSAGHGVELGGLARWDQALPFTGQESCRPDFCEPRPGAQPEASSFDCATTLEAAGFEVVTDQAMRTHLEPPLEPAARRVAVGHLEMMRHLVGPQLEPADQEALDVLIDEDHPLGIMQRQDMFLHASRHLYVARALPARREVA